MIRKDSAYAIHIKNISLTFDNYTEKRYIFSVIVSIIKCIKLSKHKYNGCIFTNILKYDIMNMQLNSVLTWKMELRFLFKYKNLY